MGPIVEAGLLRGPGAHLLATGGSGFPPAAGYGLAGAAVVVAVVVAALVGRRSGRRALAQRLTALGSRLGIDAPEDDANIERALAYLEQVTGAATEAVADSSADAIRLRRSLDNLPQGVVICNESGAVVYRNTRANSLMTSRRGDALAAQAVTELLEDAWDHGAAERTLDLYGPPRRTLSVQARLIDDGRRALGVIAMIDDISERRRLEEIRRDFVANVSHELKTPMGALGLLAETLVAEPDPEVARRLASRIQTEAFRVSRIIDDLLDLSRIESEQAPPREPVLVNLVMAEAVERVRATADQRGITIDLTEPDPPVVVTGDRRQLVSAMHALLENAVTYSYDGSTVSVSGRVVRADEPPPPHSAPAATTGGVSAPTAAPVPARSANGAGSILAAGAALRAGTAGERPEGPPSAPTPDEPVTAPAHAAHPATEPAEEAVPEPSGGSGTGPARIPAHAPAHGARPAEPEEPGLPGAPLTVAEMPAGAVNGTATSAPPEPAGPTPAPGGPAAEPAAAEPAAAEPAAAEPAAAEPSASPVTTEPAASASSAVPDTGHRPRDTVRITVTDHGVGIPARDLERIFERFYRVDHGRSRDTGGTGLGLSIVRHVANNHHGWVEVESREGEGSTFTLVLPLQPDQAA